MTEAAKRLALHEQHLQWGAKFASFAGWEVPITYRGIMEEHRCCRESVSIFDVSHMGKIYLSGDQAPHFLERIVPKRFSKIKPGRSFYTLLLNRQGGILDDLIVYEIGPQRFLLIVNAGCVEKDFAWLEKNATAGVQLKDRTEDEIMLAVQGPKSEALLERVLERSFSNMKPFDCCWVPFLGVDLFVAATGYTGERGFEIIAPLNEADSLWDRLIQGGERFGLQPAGFGARDTLRLESCYLLYGQDMNEETNPLEAGLDWTVDFENQGFIGRDSLIEVKKSGIKRKLIGFQADGPAIPRSGHSIRKNSHEVGQVTSGTFSPTLKKNIGLGYVPVEFSQTGTFLDLYIRDRCHSAWVVKTPFYVRKPM